MSKEKKIECQVLRNGVMVAGEELEVGSTIHLTERATAAMVGKVKPLKEIQADEKADKTPKGFAALKKKNAALEAQVEELEDKIAELSKPADKTAKK